MTTDALRLNRLNLSERTLAALLSKITVTSGGCWEWTAARVQGYGFIHIRRLGGTFQTHRLCYQLIHGPILSAEHLHHKVENGCIGPSCCNPEHLQKTTAAEHTLHLTPNSIAYKSHRQTACVNGHPYTKATLRIVKVRGRAFRQCRVCDAFRQQAIREEQLAAEGREKFKWHEDKKKTHCKRGHEFTPENTYMTPAGRSCKTCRKAAWEAWKHNRSPKKS